MRGKLFDSSVFYLRFCFPFQVPSLAFIFQTGKLRQATAVQLPMLSLVPGAMDKSGTSREHIWKQDEMRWERRVCMVPGWASKNESSPLTTDEGPERTEGSQARSHVANGNSASSPLINCLSWRRPMCSCKELGWLTEENAAEKKAGEGGERAGMRVRENTHDSEWICACFQFYPCPPQAQVLPNSLFWLKLIWIRFVLPHICWF